MISNRARHDIDLKALKDTPTSAQEAIGPKVYTSTIPFSSSTPMPSHSGRVVIQLDRFMYLREFFEAIPKEHEINPIYYDEVMSNDDIILWQGTMEVELEFMYSNRVWDLIEALEGIKPIGRKWVYKRKRGVDGKVEIYKARMIAKGYSQKPGFDYEETFAPVAMLKSTKILLSIVAYLDYEI